MNKGRKDYIDKWWDNDDKNFRISNYKNSWKNQGGPQFFFQTNGARRKNGDNCFDAKLVIGYIVINYTNFNLQKVKRRRLTNVRFTKNYNSRRFSFFR